MRFIFFYLLFYFNSCESFSICIHILKSFP